MGDSNGEWGDLAEHDAEFADVWDTYPRLPDEPDEALSSFLVQKGHGIPELLRLGARYRDGVLVYSYGTGLKFRDVTTGRRWSYLGSTFPALKIVEPDGGAERVIVCEGESDAGRLLVLYPECAIAVMGAGAKYFTESMADQLDGYRQVLVGLDNDEAGMAGYTKIAKLVPWAVRFPPGEAEDWCDLAGPTPMLPDIEDHEPVSILVPAGKMLEMEVPEVASYFEDAILPVGGFAMIHGWAKSFKTFLALDLLSCLAQGVDWCCFEPCEEPANVAVMQYEVRWPYYRKRIQTLMENAREPLLFSENFHTYSPLARPDLRAGDTKSEDRILKVLVDGGTQVLLLDPIRRATGSIDMNDEAEVRKMLGFFERLNDEGITVVATHHDNKTAARFGGGDPAGMTGSGAWAGDPDTIISVQLPKGDRLNDSTRRNLLFTLRNSPVVPPRGFDMTDSGFVYSPVSWTADDHDEPVENAHTPAI